MRNLRFIIATVAATMLFVGCDNAQNPNIDNDNSDKNESSNNYVEKNVIKKAIQWEYTGFGSSEVAYIVDIVSDNPEISKTDTIYKGEKCVIHTLEYQVYDDYITTENPRDKAMTEFCDAIKKIEIKCLYNSEIYSPAYTSGGTPTEFNIDYTDMKSYLFDLSRYAETDDGFCFKINTYALAELETLRNDRFKKVSFFLKWHNKMDTTMFVRLNFTDNSYLQGLVFENEIEPNGYIDLPEFYTFQDLNDAYAFSPIPMFFLEACFHDCSIEINCGDISYDNRVNGYRKPFFRYENYEYIQDVGLSYLFTKDSFVDY